MGISRVACSLLLVLGRNFYWDQRQMINSYRQQRRNSTQTQYSVAALGAVAMIALSGTIGAAQAAPVYDTLGPLAGPGTYFGTGNPNINWAVTTTPYAELGLQALIRYVGPVAPVLGVYTVPTG